MSNGAWVAIGLTVAMVIGYLAGYKDGKRSELKALLRKRLDTLIRRESKREKP